MKRTGCPSGRRCSVQIALPEIRPTRTQPRPSRRGPDKSRCPGFSRTNALRNLFSCLEFSPPLAEGVNRKNLEIHRCKRWRQMLPAALPWAASFGAGSVSPSIQFCSRALSAGRLRGLSQVLQRHGAGAPDSKLEIAARLKRETTLSTKAIAARVHLGSSKAENRSLHS